MWFSESVSIALCHIYILSKRKLFQALTTGKSCFLYFKIPFNPVFLCSNVKKCIKKELDIGWKWTLSLKSLSPSLPPPPPLSPPPLSLPPSLCGGKGGEWGVPSESDVLRKTLLKENCFGEKWCFLIWRRLCLPSTLQREQRCFLNDVKMSAAPGSIQAPPPPGPQGLQ